MDVHDDTLAKRSVTAFGGVACVAATLSLAAGLLAAVSVESAGAQNAVPLKVAPLSGAELIGHLRSGGCVLVMRHARSPGALPEAHAAKADNHHRERQLDEAGEADARAFGAAVRALRIPIGAIYSSPTYRARETVRLGGLGEPQAIEQLAESKRGMSAAAEHSQVDWLREAITRAPPAHSNVLIVTHAPNIVGAFGDRAKDVQAGESLVFEPRPGAGPRLLGRITIDEWRKLAGSR